MGAAPPFSHTANQAAEHPPGPPEACKAYVTPPASANQVTPCASIRCWSRVPRGGFMGVRACLGASRRAGGRPPMARAPPFSERESSGERYQCELRGKFGDRDLCRRHGAAAIAAGVVHQDDRAGPDLAA